MNIYLVMCLAAFVVVVSSIVWLCMHIKRHRASRAGAGEGSACPFHGLVAAPEQEQAAATQPGGEPRQAAQAGGGLWRPQSSR